MKTRIALVFLVLALTTAPNSFPDEIAVSRPPEICSLSVTVNPRSGDVIISWSGGTLPFSLVRADATCFGKASELRYLVEGVRAHRYVDVAAAKSGRRYWYQVFDKNSPTEIYYIGPPDTKTSDPKFIHPDGNGDCGDSDTCKGLPREPRTWQ